ncbi:tyrosyl-DNA phosphodiesterase-domain-containing protein [Amylostereum chailletii]|nr:tyrosyl-DNA phosphodiesterase-domain-containing protein [Amylostereum chailletii]
MPDDDDTMIASALSLEESRRLALREPPISVENNEEAKSQTDLNRDIASSKANSAGPPRTRVNPTTPVSLSPGQSYSRPVPISPTASKPTFLSERAQLEQARLARLKRFREEQGYSDITEPPRKRPTSSGMSLSGKISSEGFPPEVLRRKGKEKGRLRENDGFFWDGELRQTANRLVNDTNNPEGGNPVWRLSEIIGDKSQIELAILSSCAVSVPWIYQFFLPSTPVVLVVQLTPASSNSPTVKEILPNWIRATPVLHDGRGAMNIKFFLIFYKTGRLRIVISTANLIDYDWHDIKNSAWVQDVEKHSSAIRPDPEATDFPATFEHVLQALNVGPALTSLVHNDHPKIPLPSLHPGALRTNWDFSRVKAKLVSSIAGKHEGWPRVLKNGHAALMKAVCEVSSLRSNRQGKNVILECQGSFIGTYSTQWLNEFYTSATGESPEKWLDQPKSSLMKLPWPSIRILFPTAEWVRGSALGEKSGGMIFCRKIQWEDAKFPRELFYQSRSKRGKVLMHSKMIIAILNSPGSNSRNSDSDLEDDDVVILDEKGSAPGPLYGWAYVGSHDFTPSAWGTLSGSGRNPVLNVTIYELGIVLPLYTERDLERVACYQRPVMKYTSQDRPWMQEKSTGLKPVGQ